MLTFLPSPDYERSAEILDHKRLGKQRIEARQLLETLGWRLEQELDVDYTDIRDDLPDKGEWIDRWRRSPASRMWQGYPWSLARYYNAMVREWKRRGYRNRMPLIRLNVKALDDPSWLGNEQFHAAQRANLLRKDLEFYGKYGWTEEPRRGYVWPV